MQSHLGAIFALTLLTVLPTTACALSFNVNINTSSLSGSNATLVFDFIDGDLVINNTIQISQFLTDGSLGTSLSTGDVSGDLGSGLNLGDGAFFNTFEQQLVLGGSLQFNLQTTNLFDSSGTFPDAFAFYILDDLVSLSLITTDDPFALDALFAIDLNGTSNNLSVYADASGTSTWSVETATSAVPTPGTLLLLIAGIASAFFTRNVREF